MPHGATRDKSRQDTEHPRAELKLAAVKRVDQYDMRAFRAGIEDAVRRKTKHHAYLQLPKWMRPWIQFFPASVAARQPHQSLYLIKPVSTEGCVAVTGVQRLETGYKNFHYV